MFIDLKGTWQVSIDTPTLQQAGAIDLPGILQNQGYGESVSHATAWQSSLHDPLYYEREEYQYGQEQEVRVPFLAQPQRFFLGEATFTRNFEIKAEEKLSYALYIERTKWTSEVFLNGKKIAEDFSACTPHILSLGELEAGTYEICVKINNTCPEPYRPDGHMVSDALGGNWHGMLGQIAIVDTNYLEERKLEFRTYADENPMEIHIEDGNFVINGKAEFIRATHFGGDFPISPADACDKNWWIVLLRTLRKWGLNAIRFHSYCPPEAAFAAADEEHFYLLAEAGMWNHFEEGIPMLDVLRLESHRILEQFGHHPSFVLFSSSNEPSGNWYDVLKAWVAETKEYDFSLGYGNRRAYTAQSGWFYDQAPADVKGVDFLYFHRSAYGPIFGGNIRGVAGWKGKDYQPSIENCRIPVMGHELGQWCSYPDFSLIEYFYANNSYLLPKNYELFRDRAIAMGLDQLNSTFVQVSGKQQLRFYKEDVEANFRTPGIKGFELLDLHDYLGQGTALVGLLDPFWNEKPYASAIDFSTFCNETVLLARIPKYIYSESESFHASIEVAHYGDRDITDEVLRCRITRDGELLWEEGYNIDTIFAGGNTPLAQIQFEWSEIIGSEGALRLDVQLAHWTNHWTLYVYEQKNHEEVEQKYCSTRNFSEAKRALKNGETVFYCPEFSDLSYDSPCGSFTSAFWNSQMGPTWARSLGYVADVKHPILQDFDTEESAGWNWENLVNNSRAMNMLTLEDAHVLLRMIDDWNRSFPLALIWEANVAKGKLLFCGVDLWDAMKKPSEASPEESALARAIHAYLNQEELTMNGQIDISNLEKKLFPVHRMLNIEAKLTVDENVECKDAEAMFNPNPNHSTYLETDQFPLVFHVTFPEEVEMSGLLYLPDQRDRMRGGHIKEYKIRYWDSNKNDFVDVTEATLENKIGEQRMDFGRTISSTQLEVTVRSAYGQTPDKIWKNKREGWFYEEVENKKAFVQVAILHITKENELAYLPMYQSPSRFWNKESKSRTAEIEA